jgi:hypothetical protein
VRRALEAGEGLLRLAPTWVPRSFLMPGRRIKLAPQDVYALGAHRGGIDERWFASTTPAANEGAPPDEGLSYAVVDGKRAFTLKEAVALEGAKLVGKPIWDRYARWPVYSKFFDNLGPIPHHMHQNDEQAAKVGQQGKPESYYFPPQLNAVGNNFPYTFFGLEPGTTKADIRRCLERWNEGDNGILSYSKAYRLQPGTGWLVPPCVLHAPGSLVTYEPQWGSDVFGMYQSLVEGRVVPWSLLVKDMPKDKHQDLDYLVDQLDWEGNVNPRFKDSHYLGGLRRSLDRLRQGPRQGALQRQGANRRPGRQGNRQGQRSLRTHRRSGNWANRQTCAADSGHDPLRRADRGRGVRQPRRRPPGRRLREHRPRAARDAPLLRPGHQPARALRRRPQEEITLVHPSDHPMRTS